MKLGIIGDIHACKNSSIIRSRGEVFSTRLENVIKSLNWVESLMKSHQVDAEGFLGDTFDRADINSEEMTAFQNINWNDIKKYFLVGNHEISTSTTEYSTCSYFKSIGAEVVESPTSIAFGDTELCMLPYILEENRKTLSDYFGPKPTKRLILSHNDIKDVQMGQFKSKTGFSISDIEANCDKYVNGHLHNGGKVTDKIINAGILTGLNFGEDQFRFDHCVYIFDTETFKLDAYENPYAFNFAKIDLTANYNPEKYILKPNSVIAFKVCEDNVSNLRDFISNNKNIIESRITIEYNKSTVELDNNFESIDHIEKFKSFIIEKLGNSDIVLEEIAEIIR